MATQPKPQLVRPEPTRGELAIAAIRRDVRIYEGLRELFIERREARRLQLEQAQGETAISLRGRSLELTTILMEVFPEL